MRKFLGVMVLLFFVTPVTLSATKADENLEIARRVKDALREKYLATRVMAECLNSPDCEKELGIKVPASTDVMVVVRVNSQELHQWEIYVTQPGTDNPPVLVRFNFFTQETPPCLEERKIPI